MTMKPNSRFQGGGGGGVGSENKNKYKYKDKVQGELHRTAIVEMPSRFPEFITCSNTM